MVNVTDRINELLNEKNWTCYELSKRSGISTNTIYNWQKGAVPSLENIIKICEAFDISVEQFFCGLGSYRLTKDEEKILNEWFTMSDLEKSAVYSVIEAFKILKNDK